MSKQQALDGITYPFLGAATSIGLGALFFQVVSALLLGIVGAIGGWIAKEYVIPFLKNTFTKFSKNDKSN